MTKLLDEWWQVRNVVAHGNPLRPLGVLGNTGTGSVRNIQKHHAQRALAFVRDIGHVTALHGAGHLGQAVPAKVEPSPLDSYRSSSP